MKCVAWDLDTLTGWFVVDTTEAELMFIGIENLMPVGGRGGATVCWSKLGGKQPIGFASKKDAQDIIEGYGPGIVVMHADDVRLFLLGLISAGALGGQT